MLEFISIAIPFFTALIILLYKFDQNNISTTPLVISSFLFIVSSISFAVVTEKDTEIRVSRDCIENQCPYEQHIIYNENDEPVDTVYRKRQ